MQLTSSLGTLLLAGAFLLGCERSSNFSSSSPQRKVREKVEACALLTKEEVGEVQGTTINEAKSATAYDGSHLVSRCYYAATGPDLSVSFDVTQIDPANSNPPSVREHWEEMFDRSEKGKLGEEADRGKQREGRGENEEEEKAHPPTKVEGVGDEAFWSGTRVGGALFVLKGDVYFRISVGGPDSNEKKLEKSKTLAGKALARL